MSIEKWMSRSTERPTGELKSIAGKYCWHKIIGKFLLPYTSTRLKPASVVQETKQTILIGTWHRKYARAPSIAPKT